MKARHIVSEASRRRHVPDMAKNLALRALIPKKDVLVHREEGG